MKNDAVRKSVLFILLALSVSFISPHEPQFRNPLDIPIRLSASFGDIRKDHFHTGIDIRTNEKTGYKVYAAAEGYVSRIKVSPYGYGRALYVTHPGGYMTVYGHLDRFTRAIDEYVRAKQYAEKKFEVEIFPGPEVFSFKQGEVIAFSGNSGGSSGPHLHFEIRDAHGETFPLNPARFLHLADSIPPAITGLYVYSLSSSAEIYPQAIALSTNGKKKNPVTAETIVVRDHMIGLGVSAVDFMDNQKSDLGVYVLQAFMDDQLYFSMKLDRLSFENGRYVNAHVDYRILQQSKTTVRKLFRMNGDHNTVYEVVKDGGRITLRDTTKHSILIRAGDENGNFSELNFQIKYSGKVPVTESPRGFAAKFLFDQPNSFHTDSMRLELPGHALYDNLNFIYTSTVSGAENYLSPVHHLHNSLTPLHNAGELWLIPRYISDSLKKKAVIAYRNPKNRISALTIHWEGNFAVAKMRDFGDYFLMLDTLPPVVSVIGLQQNHLLTRTAIHFLAADNLSGISSYNGYLDGTWILLEYNAKANQLICNLDGALQKGNHSLRTVVTDKVNNSTSFTFNFKK